MSDERNLFQLLKRREHESNPAIISKDVEFTYRELAKEAELIAANLYQSCGVGPGDRVAMLLPNKPEFVCSFFAVSLLGAIAVPIGTRVSDLELEYILAHSEAKVLITVATLEGHDYLASIRKARSRLSSLEHVFSLGPGRSPGERDFSDLRKPCDVTNLVHQLQLRGESRSPSDPCLMLYTSGTTGSPKGVMLSSKNIISTLRRINKKVKARSDDRYLLVVPITSSLGCVTTLVRGIVAGACVVLMESFKAKEVLKEIKEKRITVHPGVPTMFILELMELDKKTENVDLSSLRQAFVSGSECPAEVMARIEKDMGCQVIIGYGLTESTSYVTVTNPEDPFETRINTVGSPVPGEEITIIRGDAASPDGIGEIAVRGDSVMIGYFRNPEKTRESIDEEGWFHTGDLGAFDEEGNLIFRGRKKDLVIRGGYNIYPAEIENFLLRHDKIAQVALVGIPDSVLGERSVACVIRSPGSTLTEQEVVEYCRKNLADYKIPDFVRFFDVFPLTHNSKIKKKELTETLLKEIKTR